MANYAKNLVFELFKRNALAGKNCAGVKGKQGVGDDSRMAIIKENVFKESSWEICLSMRQISLRERVEIA